VKIAHPPRDGLVSLSELGYTRIVEDRFVRLRKWIMSIGDLIALRITRVDPVRGLVDLSLL
jgi:hypothetical protein